MTSVEAMLLSNKVYKSSRLCKGKCGNLISSEDTHSGGYEGRYFYCRDCANKYEREVRAGLWGIELLISRRLITSRRMSKLHGYPSCNEPASNLMKSFTTICAICEKDVGIQNIYLDHCHKTGNFRGWLCVNCNRCLHNDITIEQLEKMIQYLRDNQDGE